MGAPLALPIHTFFSHTQIFLAGALVYSNNVYDTPIKIKHFHATVSLHLRIKQVAVKHSVYKMQKSLLQLTDEKLKGKDEIVCLP